MWSRVAALVGSLGLSLVGVAHAEDAALVVHFDLDGNPGTGCASETSERMLFGIDFRLRTLIDLDTRQVSAVSHALCLDPVTGEFASEIPVEGAPAPPWNVVEGDGTSGSSLIETRLPLSVVPEASAADVYVSLDAALGGDALLTSNGDAGGATLRLVLRPFAIPALPTWALALLALALFFALERARWLLAALLVAALGSPVLVQAALGDGTLRDWSPDERVATDPRDDAPVGVDILAAFSAVDSAQDALILRVDALLGPAMCLAWPTVDPGSGYPCNQEPPPDPGPFGQRVALTFDDGPNPATTPSILAILRAENIPATFFMTGRRLDDGPDTLALAREIHDDPLFDVANHTFNHPRFTTLTDEQARLEVTSTNDLIRIALDDPCYFPRFFRFPFSASNCATTAVVRAQGHSIVGLHIDALDWCYATGNGFCAPEDASHVPELYRNDMVGWIMFRLQQTGGGVVLMHDVHANTVLQLPAVIAALRDADVTFVRLDDTEVFPLINAAIHVPEPPACCDGVVR